MGVNRGFRQVAARGDGGVPGAVDLVVLGGAGFLFLPVGHSALRGRFPGDFRGSCTVADLAVPLAAVPPDVLQRNGETAQRGHHVARLVRPDLPLLHPAAAHAARLVYAAIAGLVPDGVGWFCFRSGTGRSFSILRAVAPAAHGRLADHRSASADSAHRELYVLQFSDNLPVHVAIYRAGRTLPRLPPRYYRTGGSYRRAKRADMPPVILHSPAARRRSDHADRRSAADRQQLWTVRGDDHRAGRNYRGGLERRRLNWKAYEFRFKPGNLY